MSIKNRQRKDGKPSQRLNKDTHHCRLWAPAPLRPWSWAFLTAPSGRSAGDMHATCNHARHATCSHVIGCYSMLSLLGRDGRTKRLGASLPSQALSAYDLQDKVIDVFQDSHGFETFRILSIQAKRTKQLNDLYLLPIYIYICIYIRISMIHSALRICLGRPQIPFPQIVAAWYPNSPNIDVVIVLILPIRPGTSHATALLGRGRASHP